MAQSQTLVQASFGASSTIRKAVIVLGGSLLIALGAQVSVPMLPVPMTLQTLAILLVGFTAGSRLGAGAVLAYLAEGAMGLPVFSGGGAGAAWLVGPTGGFLFGFVAMAWAAGFMAERGAARGFIGTLLTGLVVSALLYVPGVLWLDAATGLDLNGAVTRGMIPFLLGDAVKAAVAALIVTGAWSALKSRRG
jgi:biotin transport system substrate-specific component